MDTLSKTLLSVFLVLVSMHSSAQTESWKTSRDEKTGTQVWSRVTKIKNDSGKVHRLEFTAVDTVEARLSQLTGVMRDVSGHEDFMDETQSTLVQTISAQEWVLHYFYTPPWPIRNSDCVALMRCTIDTVNQQVTYTVSGRPELYPKKKVGRAKRYEMTYVFTELHNGKVLMQLQGDIIPAFRVPLWMMRLAFPTFPSVTMNKMVERSKAY